MGRTILVKHAERPPWVRRLHKRELRALVPADPMAASSACSGTRHEEQAPKQPLCRAQLYPVRPLISSAVWSGRGLPS